MPIDVDCSDNWFVDLELPCPCGFEGYGLGLAWTGCYAASRVEVYGQPKGLVMSLFTSRMMILSPLWEVISGKGRVWCRLPL